MAEGGPEVVWDRQRGDRCRQGAPTRRADPRARAALGAQDPRGRDPEGAPLRADHRGRRWKPGALAAAWAKKNAVALAVARSGRFPMKTVADTAWRSRARTSRRRCSAAEAGRDPDIARPATPSSWPASGPWSMPGRATAIGASLPFLHRQAAAEEQPLRRGPIGDPVLERGRGPGCLRDRPPRSRGPRSPGPTASPRRS